MFTDLGIFLGHALRGLPADKKRMQMCFLIISGFLCGGLAGAVLYHALDYSSLLIPAGLTAAASVAYEIYRFRNRIPAAAQNRQASSDKLTVDLPAQGVKSNDK